MTGILEQWNNGMMEQQTKSANKKPDHDVAAVFLPAGRQALPTDSVPNKWGRYKSLFPEG